MVALKRADLWMYYPKFVDRKIKIANFPTLNQSDLLDMGLPINDIRRFRRHFPLKSNEESSKSGTEMLYISESNAWINGRCLLRIRSRRK